VICVVAIGKAGQSRVEQQMNNLGDNFVWIEADGRSVSGVRTGTHGSMQAIAVDALFFYRRRSFFRLLPGTQSFAARPH
jgi:hypothetical protein